MRIFRKIVGKAYFGLLSVRCAKWPEWTDYVEVNGQRLLYAVRGPEDGLPVVLLHGNGGSHKSMLTQAKRLALAGYRVYSPDSRGQGANPPLEEYHYADMAEDAWAFIREMKLEKPAVYGWSDGGILVLMIELAHPGTLGLGAISGANLCPDCGPDFEEFKNWILEQDTPVTRMMLVEPDIDPGSLKAIKCPFLVTVGDKDVISIEHTHLISDNIEGSELVVVPNATHSSFIKRNPRMGRLLLDFFKRHGYVNAD
ncbi:MAG: alpha/beta hydrolase [Bacteroidales bacterium]|nr:alpha/beta hydrolase [Bacteroidales bacterium]